MAVEGTVLSFRWFIYTRRVASAEVEVEVDESKECWDEVLANLWQGRNNTIGSHERQPAGVCTFQIATLLLRRSSTFQTTPQMPHFPWYLFDLITKRPRNAITNAVAMPPLNFEKIYCSTSMTIFSRSLLLFF